MNFDVFGPDGSFLCHLPMWSWDVARILSEIQSAFKVVVTMDARSKRIDLL